MIDVIGQPVIKSGLIEAKVWAASLDREEDRVLVHSTRDLLAVLTGPEFYYPLIRSVQYIARISASNDAIRRCKAPGPSFLPPAIPILRRCDAFATNFAAVEFHASHCKKNHQSLQIVERGRGRGKRLAIPIEEIDVGVNAAMSFIYVQSESKAKAGLESKEGTTLDNSVIVRYKDESIQAAGKKPDPFFHRRKSGCPISGYADDDLEVHSVPLLRQPEPATFLLTYLPALPTAEVSAQMRDQEQI
ncbi:hypothetical protein EVAR_34437_1 [Eumeta japonica]|uniref:Uncharacterized protein n=1 Tax=Eumeta variegata TaxID=151549 RepID=A0A4C1WJX1_EUMVA|nr:hypothetical protein EVAR_34437_1 [Eumeta japonica]